MTCTASIWLPEGNIPDNIEEEHQRVEFIKKVVEVVAQKTRLRLNSKKLSAGERGNATQETPCGVA